MYKFFYEIYYLSIGKEPFNRFFKSIMIRLTNLIMPFFLSINIKNSKNKLHFLKNQNPPLFVISLTTFPARIYKVWLTIETILRQDKKPDTIILWLFKGEFPDKLQLPKRLLAQEKRGLQIRFCDENLMPHKKYYYTLKSYPNATIITIDDDTFYPPDFTNRLIQNSNKYPNHVLCFRARVVTIDQNKLLPYKLWPYVRYNTEPMMNLLPIGVGGVLYPPGSLHNEVLNIELIKKLALRADDLWLKVMGLMNQTKVVCLGAEYPKFFMPVRIKNNIKLEDENVVDGRNDMIFRWLLDYFDLSVKNL